MREIKKGIYQLDGELTKTSERPLVVVHPFYPVYQGSPIDRTELWVTRIFGIENRTSENFRDYLNDIDHAIRSRKGQVIIFETEANFSDVSGILTQHPEKRGRYMIRTHNQGIRPIDLAPSSKDIDRGLDQVAQFISSFGNQVDLAGGYIDPDPLELTGCLTFMRKELNKRGIKGKYLPGRCYEFGIYGPD